MKSLLPTLYQFLMAFSKFLANILLPWIFKCRPRLPSCFPLILLFSTKLILADFIEQFTSSLILATLGSSDDQCTNGNLTFW